MPKTLRLITLTILFLSACATPTMTTSTPTPKPAEPSPTPEDQHAGWNLVWQDEFSGDTLDLHNWAFDLGANGWGNSEMEEYTDHTDNVRVENGNLIIEAREDKTAKYGYSSARIKTQDLQALAVWPRRSADEASTGSGDLVRLLDARQ